MPAETKRKLRPRMQQVKQLSTLIYCSAAALVVRVAFVFACRLALQPSRSNVRSSSSGEIDQFGLLFSRKNLNHTQKMIVTVSIGATTVGAA